MKQDSKIVEAQPIEIKAALIEDDHYNPIFTPDWKSIEILCADLAKKLSTPGGLPKGQRISLINIPDSLLKNFIVDPILTGHPPEGLNISLVDDYWSVYDEAVAAVDFPYAQTLLQLVRKSVRNDYSGIESFAEVIKQNKIPDLTLTFKNCLDEDAWKEISEALSHKGPLGLTLKLKDSRRILSPQSFGILAEKISTQNISLGFSIDLIEARKDSAALVMKALSQNKTISRLQVPTLDSDYLKILSDTLKVNKAIVNIEAADGKKPDPSLSFILKQIQAQLLGNIEYQHGIILKILNLYFADCISNNIILPYLFETKVLAKAPAKPLTRPELLFSKKSVDPVSYSEKFLSM